MWLCMATAFPPCRHRDRSPAASSARGHLGHFEFEFPFAADYLLGGNAVTHLGKPAHKLDAAARDDEGNETIGAEVCQQLHHRLEYHFGEQLLRLRMPLRRQPLAGSDIERFRRHAGVRGDDDIRGSPARLPQTRS